MADSIDFRWSCADVQGRRQRGCMHNTVIDWTCGLITASATPPTRSIRVLGHGIIISSPTTSVFRLRPRESNRFESTTANELVFRRESTFLEFYGPSMALRYRRIRRFGISSNFLLRLEKRNSTYYW